MMPQWKDDQVFLGQNRYRSEKGVF
jgi:hypothetical protein